MAEQNSDETRAAAGRRGARPFAGPAGAPAGTSAAARPPILRAPAAAGRPARGPFAPAPVPGRPSLGAPRATTPAEVPQALPQALSAPFPDSLTSQVTAEPAAAPVESIGTPSGPIDHFAADSHAGAGADEEAMRDGAPLSLLDASSLGSGIDAQQLWGDEIIALPVSVIGAPPDSQRIGADGSIELEPTATSSWPGVEHNGEHEMPAPVNGTERAVVPDTVVMDVDVNWGDVPSIPSADEVIASEPASVEVLGQAIAMPDETTSDGADPVATATVPDSDDVAERHAPMMAWPAPLPVEYPAYAAAPEASGWTSRASEQDLPEAPALADATADTPVRSDDSALVAVPEEALVPEPAVLEFGAPEATILEVAGHRSPDTLPDALSTHEVRVSAALDRLAERVRGGEIDVSSVAPEATEAAVLASVLAALLRGSSTR